MSTITLPLDTQDFRVEVDSEEGIADVVFGPAGAMPAMDARGHAEMVNLWPRLDAMPEVRAILSTISMRSERNVGSPPVRRILRKPTSTAACATRSISAALSTSSDGAKLSGRSGMQ